MHARTTQQRLVSSPHDASEHEADRVAERIIRGEVLPRVSAQLPDRAVPSSMPGFVRDALAGPAYPLDAATRAFMEPRFGVDFSRVRVHTDPNAAKSARALDAAAYTVGRDIVFGAGHYEPRSAKGRSLVAHELAHVQQSALGAAPLQRKLVDEEVGGCGLCRTPRWVGTKVHTLVQSNCFPPEIVNEFPFGFVKAPPGSSGRLDLLELQVDSDRQTVEAYIGEIKPNTQSGVTTGWTDLTFYQQRVSQYLKRGYPNFAVTVEFLDVAPQPATIPYIETAGCPPQTLNVELHRGGLYLYDCSPLRSELRSSRGCCSKRDEDAGETLRLAAPMAWEMTILGEGEADQRDRKEKRQGVALPRRKATAQGSSSTGRKVIDYAARATLLTRIAAINVRLFAAFAEGAMANIYWGGRGQELNDAFVRMIHGLESLDQQVGHVVALSSGEEFASSVDGEASTDIMRKELLMELRRVEWMVGSVAADLSRALQFSAIEQRVPVLALNIGPAQVLRENLTAALAQGDDSYSLSRAASFAAQLAGELGNVIASLVDNYEAIVRDDQQAWLQVRR